jgi:antitoxin MazE
MRTTVSKWGNSLALRLPRHIADQMSLAEGTTVTLEVSDGALRITPERKKYKLSELLEGEPKRDGIESREVDWGPRVGDEEW